MSKVKSSGQVFTPGYLVSCILDAAGYTSGNIANRHVIDNSCGDGAFLIEIVRRYCDDFMFRSTDKDELSSQLSSYIHGIEIDEEHHQNCIRRLNQFVERLGIPSPHWDILNADTLKIDQFDGKMDFVVGNPPYVRVHNLEGSYKDVKRFGFASGGMTDLYLVFFQIGFKMLSATGKLCYITPSSWINSVAGETLRRYIVTHNNLLRLIDLRHFQAFEGATTYTLIALFNAVGNNDNFGYDIFDGETMQVCHIANLNIDEAFIGSSIYLGSHQQLESFGKIMGYIGNEYVEVKNGFATLADNVFIADSFPFSANTIPIIKASTGKWLRAIYPYDENGTPIAFEKLDEEVANYLIAHKHILLKGREEEDVAFWYQYGRTQALRDVSIDKWAINAVIKGIDSIKLNRVPAGSGLYSGLYIVTKASEETLREALFCADFIDYVAMLKKYKSGGYYTFNSRELELYLNFKINQINKQSNEQSRILGSYPSLF